MKTKKTGADSSLALEQDSQRMEERLQVLKKMMSIEKASRESSSATHFWGSSQTPTRSHSGSGTGEWEPGRGTGTRRPPGGKVKLLTGEEVAGREVAKSRKCGQCEKPSAKVACIECGEDYCLTCFARFHQKGALSRHRVKPIKKQTKRRVREVEVGKTSCDTSPAATRNSSTISMGGDTERGEGGRGEAGKGEGEVATDTESGKDDKRPLWEGEYDEKASAQSFQEALAEWRAAHTAGEPAVTNTPQATSCSTQTTAKDPKSTTRTPDTEKNISFGKKTGGVSYFEKMMIRRLQTNPHFLLSSHPTLHQNQVDTNEKFDSEKETSAYPSEYNLFHSSEAQKSVHAQSLLHSLSPTSSDPTDAPRPASSVRIEEVKFAESSNSSSCQTEVVVDEEKRAKKDAPSKPRRLRERGKRHSLQKSQQQAKKDKRTQSKVSSSGFNGSNSCNERKDTSSSPHQTFSHTVQRILDPHTKLRSSTWSEGKLAGFFLSGVEESDTLKEERAVENGEEGVSVMGGGGGPPLLPISATVWLPGNSLAPLEDKPVNTCIDPLDHSVYCIETDLPPPSRISTNTNNNRGDPIQPTAASDSTESETDEERETENFGDDSSCDEDTEDYGRDSETLEDLAWELQSLTSGRCTRCEPGEGVEEDGGGGGEGEKDKKELEAEIERVKSSFEIYQQELMQQDSD